MSPPKCNGCLSLQSICDALQTQCAEAKASEAEMRRIYENLNVELRKIGQDGLAVMVELTRERDRARELQAGAEAQAVRFLKQREELEEELAVISPKD